MYKFSTVADRQHSGGLDLRCSRLFSSMCTRLLWMLGIAGTTLLAGCGGSATGSQNPQSVSVQVASGSVMPAAVATQVGTGAWTAATLQNGQFTIAIPADTQNYAYAFVCPASSQGVGTSNGNTITEISEYIFEQSVGDGTSPTISTCPNPNPSPSSPAPPSPKVNTVSLTVDASAIPNTAAIATYSSLSAFFYNLGGFDWQDSPPLSGNKGTLNLQLTSGTTDIAVVAYDQYYNPLATYILYSQTIPGPINGGNPVVLSPSDATSLVTVNYQNPPSGWTNPFLFASFVTQNNGVFVPLENYSLSGASYYAIPASQQKPGGLYWIETGVSYPEANSNFMGNVSVGLTSQNPVPSVTLPAPLPTSDEVATVATWPTFNIAYAGFSNLGLTASNWQATLSWQVPDPYIYSQSPSTYYSLSVMATSAYLSGATTLPVQDLSSIPGFIAPPSTGNSVQWSVSVWGQNDTNGSSMQSGLAYANAEVSGSYTAP